MKLNWRCVAGAESCAGAFTMQTNIITPLMARETNSYALAESELCKNTSFRLSQRRRFCSFLVWWGQRRVPTLVHARTAVKHKQQISNSVWMSLQKRAGAGLRISEFSEEFPHKAARPQRKSYRAEAERRCDWMHLNTNTRAAWKIQNVLQGGASVFPSIHGKWKRP